MLKVLLADTDTDHVKNFKTYIRLAFPEIKVLGSLTSSVNFVNQVKEQSPNLIIADIRFFGTAAQQIIRDTYEFFPDKRFIIYGTYNDAEYMQRLTEFGVIDYIFRPVKPGDLEKCLTRAIKVFDEMSRLTAAKDKLISKYKDNIAMFRDRFLENLIGGHLEDELEITSGFKYFGLNLNPGYSVFTVRIDHFKKIILTLDEMEKYLLVYRILLIINEGLQRIGNGAALVNRLNTITVILGGSMPLFDTIEFCDGLRLDILHQVKINVSIGMGRIYKQPRDIAVSFRESEAALRYKHVMGYGTVIPIHFVEPLNTITYRYPLEKEDRLVYSAVTGEYEYCRLLLRQIIDALRQCEPLPAKLIPKIIMDILFSINRFASEQQLHIEDRFTQFFPSKNVIELKTLDEAFAYMDGALKSFCGYILEIRNENIKVMVQKVKNYIDAHFRENISLLKLASFAETTPEFLSNVFYGETGLSVYQYAIDVRMQNAGRLLRETVMTEGEIAKETGYDDLKHFSAVFRQHHGMSATEHRLRFRV